LNKKVKEKEEKISKDADFLEIFCKEGHLLEKTSFKPPEGLKPKCAHCQQPHIDAHDFYYRCIDPSHGENKHQHFTLCRICALCYNTGSKGPKLQKSMHIGIHEHHLHRHPIKNRNQWTCHSQSEEFKKYC
jgi:hypothetical protein